jgi:hypothetical protein
MPYWKIWLPIVLLAGITGLTFLAWPHDPALQDATGDSQPEIVVYKTPTCSCCDKWVDHVRASGFEVTAHDLSHAELNDRKIEGGLAPGMASCHTAFVDGYTIEGHVPAAEIKRLLELRPEIAGLTVPGMPIGSPGMEMGNRVDDYEVLGFHRDGNTEVFATYPPEADER